MKLTQTRQFFLGKLYWLISFISRIVQALLNFFYFFVPVLHIFFLNILNIITYNDRWWKKYLSKPSLIKHNCSWCDKLIILWTPNRYAKIYLRMLTDEKFSNLLPVNSRFSYDCFLNAISFKMSYRRSS